MLDAANDPWDLDIYIVNHICKNMKSRCLREKCRGPFLVGQDALQTWARGTVWDCSDAERCVPVVRSTLTTTFPGPWQIDREALPAAERLEWGDTDIVEQMCGGGVEPQRGL
eukprot:1501927-Pleurochrysis_carterae.AAC.1